MNKYLSIIIPVYNGEAYLKECLDSILDICQKDLIEIIIINDGSTDSTMEILRLYDKESNIIIYDNENYGVSFSRNFGIERATGKYIMFVDADDILDGRWYEKVLPYLKLDEDYIVFNNKIINKDKNSLLKYITGANKEKICIAGPVSKLYSAKFLKTNNIIFKEDLINGEDMIFNIEVVLKSARYKIISSSFYKYRMYVGSSTKRFSQQIINNDIIFHEYLNTLIKNSMLDENVSIEIINYLKLCGILTVIDRISYNRNFREARKYYSFVEMAPYKYFFDLNSIHISKFNRILLMLCQTKNYRTVYYVLKLKHILINQIRKNKLFIEL